MGGCHCDDALFSWRDIWEFVEVDPVVVFYNMMSKLCEK